MNTLYVPPKTVTFLTSPLTSSVRSNVCLSLGYNIEPIAPRSYCFFLLYPRPGNELYIYLSIYLSIRLSSSIYLILAYKHINMLLEKVFWATQATQGSQKLPSNLIFFRSIV